MASVKTAMWAQGAISGCGAAGSDSKNMVRGGSLKPHGFNWVLTLFLSLQLMASPSLSVTLFVFNKKGNNGDCIKDVHRWFDAHCATMATVL